MDFFLLGSHPHYRWTFRIPYEILQVNDYLYIEILVDTIHDHLTNCCYIIQCTIHLQLNHIWHILFSEFKKNVEIYYDNWSI